MVPKGHPPIRRPVACITGSRKRFRVRYDRTVSFDPYDDGFGIMRDAQTAKPQTFITGDGWFVYNLAVNPGQPQAQDQALRHRPPPPRERP